MHNDVIRDLADCTEFRQSLEARSPRVVHGTLILLATLLATVLVWSAATKVDLVVRASGRVRPVASPLKLGSGEALGASVGRRIIEVNFHEGQEVRGGDVLVRLDTEQLDNEIAKRQRAVQTGDRELAELNQLEMLLSHQFESGKAKAGAELTQAREEVRQAEDRQAADVRLAELELQKAQHEETQVRQLGDHQLVARDELRKAVARVRESQERLDKARLQVDTGRVEVLRRALELGASDYAMRRQELQTKRGIKQGEVEALRIDLDNLQLERKQAFIRAPMRGIVTTGDVKVGEILEQGRPVVEIAQQKGFHFEVAVPSEEVGHLRVGMAARIKLDAYDYQRYGTVGGTVVFISPDSSLPPEQQMAAYLVKIKLEAEELGRGDLRGRAKLGMAGQADIVTGQESLLVLFVKKLRHTISLG
jgi:membrane fusion protein, hemolysin D